MNNAIKKILVVSAAMLCLASITSCDVSETIEDNAVTINPEFERQHLEDEADIGVGEMSSKKIYIWTDKDTGVQYVVYRDGSGYAGMGGITPRLNPDGSLYGVETATDNTEQ